MKTIHIHFEGDNFSAPDNNDWEKFRNVEALRCFMICAKSWENRGWQVRRLSVQTSEFEPLSFRGAIRDQFHWLPEWHWQIFAVMRAIMGDNPGYHYFTQADVLNHNFDGLVYEGIDNYIFQWETFTMATLCLNRSGLEKIIDALLLYDRGFYPVIRGSYIGPDQIIRQYSELRCFPIQKFSCSQGNAQLIHYARAGLMRDYLQIAKSL